MLSTKFYRHSSFEQIYLAIIKELRDNPEFIGVARDIHYREIAGLSFELTNPYDRFVWNGARKVNYEFGMRFFLWMLGASNDYEYVKGVNPNAANYIDPNKLVDPKQAQFSTAYGPRIMRQMEAVLDELKRDDGSRRAVVSILDEGDLKMLGTGTKEEFPCIESLTFFIRGNRLHCHCQMRSNNMATTVVYDVFCFTMFQEYVLRRLQEFFPNLEMGTYYHHCTSAHYFDTQEDLVERILSAQVPPFLSRADGGQKLVEVKANDSK